MIDYVIPWECPICGRQRTFRCEKGTGVFYMYCFKCRAKETLQELTDGVRNDRLTKQ